MDEKVHMIIIYSNLKKSYLISLGYLHADLFQFFIHFISEHYSPIFGRADQMIQNH